MSRHGIAIARFLTLNRPAWQGSDVFGDDARATAAAVFFISDETVLSENIYNFVERQCNLSADRRPTIRAADSVGLAITDAF